MAAVDRAMEDTTNNLLSIKTRVQDSTINQVAMSGRWARENIKDDLPVKFNE